MNVDLNLLIETINEQKTPIKEQLSIALEYNSEDRKKIINNAFKNFEFEEDNEMIQICKLASDLEEFTFEDSINYSSILNIQSGNEIKKKNESNISNMIMSLSKTKLEGPYKLCKAYFFIKKKMYQRALFLLSEIETQKKKVLEFIGFLTDVCHFYLGKSVNNSVFKKIRDMKYKELIKNYQNIPKLSILFLRLVSSPFHVDDEFLNSLYNFYIQKNNKDFENLPILIENSVNFSNSDPRFKFLIQNLLKESLENFSCNKDIALSIIDLLIKEENYKNALKLSKEMRLEYQCGKLFHKNGEYDMAMEYYSRCNSIFSKYNLFILEGYPVNVELGNKKRIIKFNELNNERFDVVVVYLRTLLGILDYKYGIKKSKFSNFYNLLRCIQTEDIYGIVQGYNCVGEFIEEYIILNNKIFYLEKIRRILGIDVKNYINEPIEETEIFVDTRIGKIQSGIHEFYCKTYRRSMDLAPKNLKKHLYYNLWILNLDMKRTDDEIYDIWECGVKNFDWNIKEYPNNFYVAYHVAKEMKKNGVHNADKLMDKIMRYYEE